jgi:hypothetical protein
MKIPMIEMTKPEVPNPLPTDHQALMDCMYKPWQALGAKVRERNQAAGDAVVREPTREEMMSVMPPKIVAAVILGNHSYQVHNGGWMQWHDNRYSDNVEGLRAIYEGAAAIGIDHAETIVKLIDEFIDRTNAAEGGSEARRFGRLFGDDEDHDDFDNRPLYDDLDTRLYDLPMNEIMQEVLDRFDEVVGHAFVAGSFRRAA